MTVLEGQEVTLQVAVEGVPPPKVEWFFDDKRVEASKNVTLEKDGKTYGLTIKSASSVNEGEYKVVATNKSGPASYSAEVLVSEVKTPSGEISTKFIEVLEGEDACFEVVAENTESLSWYRGEEPVKEGRKFQITKDDGGVNKLTILRCRLVDAGSYSCELMNGSKTVELKATLVVEKADSELDREDGKANTGKP